MMNKKRTNRIGVFVNGIKILLILLASVFLLQCKSTGIISGYEDFFKLSELERFEYEYSLHEGIKYKLFGDYSRANYFLKRSIEIFPYSDVANFELSNIYMIAGEYEKSVQYAEEALIIDQNNIWYYHHLANLFRELEEIEQAIAVYEKAVELFSDDVELLFSLAAMYNVGQYFEKALAVYSDIEEFIGIDERISISRQQIFMRIGEFEKAYYEIKKLVDKFPDEPSYLGILAELYSAVNMYSEALETYQKLFRLDPENGMAQLSVAEFFIKNGKFEDAIYYLISAFRNQNIVFEEKISFFSAVAGDSYLTENYSDAIENLALLLLEEYPDRKLPKVILTEFYINLGLYDKAGDILIDLYTDEPDNIDYAEKLLVVKGYAEKYDEVIKYGETIVQSFPGSYISKYFLGIAYYMKGDKDIAKDIFDNLIEIERVQNDMKSHVLSLLGDIFNSKGEYKKSDEYFERSIALDGENLVALNNYAYYLALRGQNLDKALKYSYITIENEPENSSFLDTYAWIMYKLERLDEALEYIEHAYRNNGSESYEILKHYGQILIGLEKYDEAKGYFLRARELTEDLEEIDKLISTLEKSISN